MQKNYGGSIMIRAKQVTVGALLMLMVLFVTSCKGSNDIKGDNDIADKLVITNLELGNHSWADWQISFIVENKTNSTYKGSIRLRLYDEDDVMLEEYSMEGSDTFEQNEKVKKSVPLTNSQVTNATWGKIVYGSDRETSDRWIFDFTANVIEFRK